MLEEALNSNSAFVLFKRIMSPPNIGAVLGIMVGVIPCFERIFIGHDAPLYFVTDALETLGNSTIPCLLVSLGATMYKGPGAGNVPTRVVAGLALTRLVIAPIVGVVSVQGMYSLGLLEVPDRMFMLVLFTIHAMPTAMNVQLLASMSNSGEMETATLLFWQYALCVITVPINLFVFLRIITEVPPAEPLPPEL